MDQAMRECERSGDAVRVARARARAGMARPATGYQCLECGDVLPSVLAAQGTSVGLEGEEFCDSCEHCGEAVTFALIVAPLTCEHPECAAAGVARVEVSERLVCSQHMAWGWAQA